MPATERLPASRRLMLILRRLVHSAAYFLASLAALALFVLVLMLAENVIYALFGVSVSPASVVLAAIAAVFGYAPVVHLLQRGIDRLLFGRRVDTQAAIRRLGAGDLASLPLEDIEQALLARICEVAHRRHAALDERQEPGGGLARHPPDAPDPEADRDAYELCLGLPHGQGTAKLWLGPRIDGWPTGPEERAALESLARFAAMSLEHARLTHRVAEAARLDSLSRITRQLHSHDLKNRLHDLNFLARHLAQGDLEPDDLRRLVDAIAKVSLRVRTLMLRLSDPNAPLNPRKAPVDLGALLKRLVRERIWPEGILIEQNVGELPPVAGDEELLTSVFENLFDNAVQAMQSRGRLTIEAESAGDEAVVRVTDTGCGMSREFLEQRLFRLFATNKPNGIGVGLYLTRRIVEAHGGRIEAESPGPGKGASFIVRLPAWRGDEARANATARKEHA